MFAGALCFVPAAVDWANDRLDRRVRALPLAAVLVAAAATLFPRTKLWGDGTLVVNNLEAALESGYTVSDYLTKITPSEHVYPLTDALFFAAAKLLAPLGFAPRVVVAAIGVIMAVGTASIIVRLGASRDNGPRAFTVATLCATGAIVYALGYVEVYTPVWLAAIGFTVLSIVSLRDASYHRWMWGTLIVGIMLHVEMTLLVPMAIVTSITLRSELWARRASAIACFAIPTAWLFVAQSGIPRRIAEELATFWGQEHSVITGAHWANILNEIVLLVPLVLAVVIVVGGLRAGRKSLLIDRREFAIMNAGATAGLFFLVGFLPKLGMTRDWDVYAVPAGCVMVMVAVSLSRAQDSFPQLRRPIAANLMVALVVVFAHVGVHASNDRSTRRYVALLDAPSQRPGYTYEVLAKHYANLGDHDKAGEAIGHAYDHSKNPRYLLWGADHATANGDTTRALHHLDRLLVREQNLDARLWQLNLLHRRSEWQRLAANAEIGIQQHPQDPWVYYHAGKANKRLNNNSLSVSQLEACLTLGPPADLRREVLRLLDKG